MFSPGQDQLVRMGDKVWHLDALGVGTILAFRDWIREQLGDPYETLERFADKLPKEEFLAQLREVQLQVRQLKCFTMSSSLARDFLSTEAGGAQLYWLLLRKHHPEATVEDAFKLALHLGSEGQEKAVLETAHGVLEGNESAPSTKAV